MGDPRPHVDVRVSSQEGDGARWAVRCSTCGSELYKDVGDVDLLRTLYQAMRHVCS